MRHLRLSPGDSPGGLAPLAGKADHQAAPYYYHVQASDPESAGAEASGSVLEYWNILRRRKATVLLIALLGVILGILFTLPLTPVYRARASVEIQGINENFLNMRDVNPTTSEMPYAPELDLQTQVKILQSQSLLERVIAKLKLESQPFAGDGPTRIDQWRVALHLGAPNPILSHEDLLRETARKLSVRTQASTRIVEILYDSTNPQLAADFANAMATEYIDQNLESRWQSNQRTSDWLKRQMQDLKTKLEASEDQLQIYARSAGLTFTGEKENVTEQKLKQLQEELSRAQADRISRQSRYELARSASPEALPEVLDDTVLKDYQVKLTDLRRQMAELGAALTPANPKVVKMQAQIVSLESALERTRGNIVRRIRNEYESAQRRESLLASDYSAHTRFIADQATKVNHYNLLKRDVDTTRQVYESMFQRVKEAGIASALRASNIRVVDSAELPRSPDRPSLMIDSLIGLLAALFVGCVFVIQRERADHRIQEPEELGSYLGVPELAVIPSGEAGSRKLLMGAGRGQTHNGSSATKAPLELSLNGRKPAREPLAADMLAVAAWQRKPSVFAESFRSALTSIMFSGENGNRPRVLVISSPNPGEGKTTVATNLAIALAEIELRVLLIDGDLRKPRLHEIFGLENSGGLSDCLRTVPGCAGSGLVQPTDIPKLFVLPSGAASQTYLLYSQRLADLLATARKEFDMVLIDTPPMLQMPDARVLARQADAAILIVRADQTTRAAVTLAAQRFEQDGTRILGTILNDWDPKKAHSRSYAKYQEHYRHYYQVQGAGRA